MSDKGDKACPLCAEEMDLTDQQLKPCKCGYEVCVWCWNHIMEMAEKDATEGRCPACRTPYDKDKIVGMAAKCERLVAEMNSERKLKSQKVRPKTPEGKMHLSDVRVIQRNLVYIIGLPLNLADESLLQQREYFGQYGKVLKVSVSRAATGVIQHSSNNSCCVYITYAREGEAIRCIQSVHSFVLEGKPLRACFGTTKYCHAWLKNMPCSVSDCLYLHDFGSPEDSFTKDDLVSAFTRSRVEQIVGASNNLHRRSGNVLPPPVDDYINREIPSTAKLDSKTSSNNAGCWDGGIGVDCSIATSNALPGAASWVTRTSLPPVTSPLQADRNPYHKIEMSNDPQFLPFEDLSSKSCSSLTRAATPKGHRRVLPEFQLSRDHMTCPPSSYGIDKNITPPTAAINSLNLNELSSGTCPYEDENLHGDGAFQGVCSELSSISLGSYLKDKHSDPSCPERSSLKHNASQSQGFQQDCSLIATSTSEASSKRDAMDDFLGFNNQGLEDLRSTCSSSCKSCVPYSEQHKKGSTHQIQEQSFGNHCTTDNTHPSSVPINFDGVAYPSKLRNEVLSNGSCDNHASGYTELDRRLKDSRVSPAVGLAKVFDGHDKNPSSVNCRNAPDMGESSIISNILSMDSDAWEDSLSSPESLVKLLARSDQHCSNIKIPCLRKTHDGTQSRFSFAWHDDSLNQFSHLENSLETETNGSSVVHDFSINKDMNGDRYHSISSNSAPFESDGSLGWHPLTSSSFSVSKVSSPPPGFSAPKAIPPAFLTLETLHDYNHSGNRLQQNSGPTARNIGFSENVGLIDPATFKVGEGFNSARLNNRYFDGRAALTPQFSPFDRDAELQMLMHPPVSSQQNQRYSDRIGNKFSSPNDTYGISPLHLVQSPPNKPSSFLAAQQLRNLHMPNSHWGGWNEVKSTSDLGLPELLTNGDLRFNKFIPPSYEDLKYQIPSSSSLYNRGFAM